MGEAKRRKLAGTYPDTSSSKMKTFGSSGALPDPRPRLCADCNEGGGTLVAAMRDNKQVYVHAPNCQYAAASRARAEHNAKLQAQYLEMKRKTGLR